MRCEAQPLFTITSNPDSSESKNTGFSEPAGIYISHFTDSADYEYVNFHLRDSTIYIHGDTMKLIRLIFLHYLESHERVAKMDEKLNRAITTGIDFYNQVPGYFKTEKGNCNVRKYKQALNELGYQSHYSYDKPCGWDNFIEDLLHPKRHVFCGRGSRTLTNNSAGSGSK